MEVGHRAIVRKQSNLEHMDAAHCDMNIRTGQINTLDYVNTALRMCLSELGVKEPDSYSTKCFRRGSAQEMLRGEGNLSTVLRAGEWSSRAFAIPVEKP